MEPVFHLLIPVILILAIYPKLPKKYVFLLAPLTFLMDFDMFLPGEHRILFHNIFFLFIVAFVIYLIWNKRAFFVSLFYLSTHVLFDIAKPGAAWFYPFIERTFYVDAYLLFKEGFHMNFGIRSVPLSELSTIVAQAYSHWFTPVGLMLIVGIFVLLIFKKK